MQTQRRQGGQSLVEFAFGSLVLVILLGGVADFSRVFYFSLGLREAASQSARHGAWFDSGVRQNSFLDDPDILAVAAQVLGGSGLSLPQSSLRPGCPQSLSGAYHNPPYLDSQYPPASQLNQPWLYICYDTSAGVGGGGAFANGPPAPGDASMTGKDLAVVVLMRAGLVSGIDSSLGGGVQVAAMAHFTIQGGQ